MIDITTPEFLGEAPHKKGALPPCKLAKVDEHSHQVALFAWTALPDVRELWPELKWFHAIANGGSRGDTDQSRRIEGGKMKAEGVKKGVYDTFLPCPHRSNWGFFTGLYIEMKKLKAPGVGPSEEQTEFGDFVESQGFAQVVCYGWQEARDVLIAYLNGRC